MSTKPNWLLIAAVFFFAMFFVGLLTACSVNQPDPDISGDWVYQEEGVTFTATVKEEGGITMYVDFDGSQGLYWVGTMPPELTDGDTFVSSADTEALSKSLFGSLDSEKEFTYSGGELRFDFTMMGVTKEVGLTR